MDERINKLPKWAKDEITRLNSNLETAKRRLKSHDEKTGPIVIDIYSSDAFHVHGDAAISYSIGDGPGKTFTISIIEHDGQKMLEINCSLGALHVLPRSANLIYLKPAIN